MAYRTFVDADGVSWQVWDVHPEMAERRAADRRRAAGATWPPYAEQRRLADRRRRVEKRCTLRAGFERGWLAFDSVAGARRLAPIPDDWTEHPDAMLAAWCRQAIEVPRPRRRLIE